MRYTPPPTELSPEARRRVRAWFESMWPTFCEHDPKALRMHLRIEWEEFRNACIAKQLAYRDHEHAFRNSLLRHMRKHPSGRDPISPAPNPRGNRPFAHGDTSDDVTQIELGEWT